MVKNLRRSSILSLGSSSKRKISSKNERLLAPSRSPSKLAQDKKSLHDSFGELSVHKQEDLEEFHDNDTLSTEEDGSLMNDSFSSICSQPTNDDGRSAASTTKPPTAKLQKELPPKHLIVPSIFHKSLSSFSAKLSPNKNKNEAGKYIGRKELARRLTLSEQRRGLVQTSLYSCLEEDEDEAFDHLVFLTSRTSMLNEFEV
jgi:hypothetical protein